MTADGRRNCGPLEKILWRQWDAAAATPPPQVVAAIDRLAEFPRQLQEKLAAGLDGIYVGAGGVPDLDDMAALHGVPLPSGKATWDACAGAYGDRKIVVGTRPSPTPDVMCHEVGHALDDLDSPPGKWQSDSAEFRLIYDQCQPYIASDFHRQRGGLGRKEFFADSFAAIASAQRPALVDMLGGNTRVALRVMLYFKGGWHLGELQCSSYDYRTGTCRFRRPPSNRGRAVIGDVYVEIGPEDTTTPGWPSRR